MPPRPADLIRRIESALPRAGSLGQRMMASSGWLTFQILGGGGLRLFSNLVMTRLLVPEAFGLMGFVLSVQHGIEMLSDLGVARSIQREPDGDQQRFLRVAWAFGIGRGFVVSATILVAAAMFHLFGPDVFAAGSVYAAPEVPMLLVLTALIPLITAASSPVMILAMRRLEIRRLTLVRIAIQIVQMIAMISFAVLVSATVWALMFGVIFGSLLTCLASHSSRVFPGQRMRLAWDREIAVRLWKFGRWLLVSSPFGFLLNQGDRLIFAALLDAHSFGIYVIARLWVDALKGVVSNLISRIGFAGLSEIVRERPEDLPRLFARIQKGLELVTVAGFVGLVVLARPLIATLYSDEYHDAGGYLQILSLAMLPLVTSGIGALRLTKGDTAGLAVIGVLGAAVLWIALPAAHFFLGLPAAIGVGAVAPLTGMLILLRRSREDLPAPMLNRLALWVPAVLVTAIVVVAIQYL